MTWKEEEGPWLLGDENASDDDGRRWKAVYRSLRTGQVSFDYFLKDPRVSSGSDIWGENQDVIVIDQSTGEIFHEQGETLALIVWEIKRREEEKEVHRLSVDLARQAHQ